MFIFSALRRWINEKTSGPECVRVSGRVKFELFNADGSLAEKRDFGRNLIVNAGKAGLAGLANGSAGLVFKYLAIGTGATAAAVTDTTLQTEIASGGGSRALATTINRTTTTVTNDTMQLVLTYTFSAGFTITEAGIFDAVAAGVMLARKVFTGIVVVSTQTLQVTWQVKFS